MHHYYYYYYYYTFQSFIFPFNFPRISSYLFSVIIIIIVVVIQFSIFFIISYLFSFISSSIVLIYFYITTFCVINYFGAVLSCHKAKPVEHHWSSRFLCGLLHYCLINMVHIRNITEMPCHAMSSASSFQSELCHLPCPASKNRRCFWRAAMFATLARWGVKTGAGVMERVPISPLGEGWNPEWLRVKATESRRVMSKRLDPRAQMEGLNRRFDLLANQGHVERLFISLTNGHNIFGDWCSYE